MLSSLAIGLSYHVINTVTASISSAYELDKKLVLLQSYINSS
ncbi:hypothetical protein HMPREF1867_00710 [Veillonella dispar]|nr:hypothetical protein HMPREF1867_00710 [Veillonella dispar]